MIIVKIFMEVPRIFKLNERLLNDDATTSLTIMHERITYNLGARKVC